jgi:Tol biopolymer transport system component
MQMHFSFAADKVKEGLGILPGSEDARVLEGPYLGQKPPGLTAAEFNGGVLFGDRRSFNVSFSPDGKELFFSHYKATPECPHPEYEIALFDRLDDVWQGPSIASFSGVHSDVDVTFSPDGSRLFFASDRPHPTTADMDIYYLERTKSGWSPPIHAGNEVNTVHNEVHATLSEKGHLFFASNRPGGFGDKDLYRAEWVDGRFTNVTNLGSDVNSEFLDSDCFVARDESYIVFDTMRPETGNRPHIYVTFQKADGSWSRAVTLGEAVNPVGGRASAPTLSPDGKYLFFSQRKAGYRGIRWISTEVIERLRAEVLR